MSEYFVGSTGANNQTNFSSLDTSEVLDDLGLNTGDSPTFSGLFLEGSGSTIFSVDGSNGRLFGVTDEVTGTVFSVNDAAGLPIIEVESTSSYDKITLGEYGSDLLVLSGQTSAEVTGSQIATQSWISDQGFSADTNYYLTGVSKSGNTFTFEVNGASDPTYTLTSGDITGALGYTPVTLEDDGSIEAEEFIGDLRGAVSFKAQAGEAIAKGEAVFISGISGNTTVVGLADANDATRMPAFGIASEAASANNPVTVINFGSLDNLDTDTPNWDEGDELFVSNTAGALTTTPPTSESSLLQKIAKVTRRHASAGSITVMGAGRSNAVPNLNEGRLFVGNSSNQAVADDTAYVDIANSRVGIGTTSPQNTLHVNGTLRVGPYYATSDRDHFLVTPSGTVTTVSTPNENVNYDNSSGNTHIRTNSGYNTPVERLTVLAGGNVGIGTTSPDYALDVETSNNNCIRIRNENGSSTNGLALSIGSSSPWIDITQGQAFRIKHTPYASLGDWNSGSNTRFFISSGGNVGIGTTSPSQKLHVVGNTITTGVSYTDIVQTYSGSSIDFRHQDASVVMRVDTPNARIGIGTTTPAYQLDIENSSNATARLHAGANASASLRLQNDAQHFDVNLQTNDKFAIYDHTAGTQPFTILPTSGNVGIGTTSPAEKLHVNGIIRTHNSTETKYINVFGGNSGNFIDTYGNSLYLRYGGDSSKAILLDSSGNVGIGTTSPTAKLQVYSTATSNIFISGHGTSAQNNWAGEHAFFVNAGNGIIVGKANANNDTNRLYTFYNDAQGNAEQYIYNTSNVATIKLDSAGDTYFNGGNVGIGDTTPSYKLDVAGDIRATGDLRADDDVFIAGDVLRFTNDAASAYIQSADALILEADYDADDTGGKPITFKTAGTTKMTIAGGGDVTINNGLIVSGDLTVNGTTSTINSTTVQVDDKNIELGTVASPTDTTADGGGITLKGATDKTINWVNSTDAWTFSERVSIPAGSASAPSLTFAGDEDTGIYRSAANRIGFSAGGSQRAYIDANGITAQGNVYASADFRNYSNVWKASTGLTGNGFEFNNSVDGTALTISSTGDTVASGKITSGNDIVNATAGVYTWVGDTDTYIQRSAGNEITIKTGASNALVLDSSQNATFAGDLSADNITSTSNGGSASIYINSTRPTLGFTDSNSFTDPNDIYIVRAGGNDLKFQWYDDTASSTTDTFSIDNSGNATFGGNLTVNSTITTPTDTNLSLSPNGSGHIYLGDSGNGMNLYHYSNANDGKYTGYDFNGNYYRISTTATSGIKFEDHVTSTGSLTAANLSLSSLSAQTSELTALMINSSNVVGTRELNTAAFVDSSEFASASHTHAASDITSGTLNADRLPRPINGDWWNGGAVIVGTDGVMEVGKYLDFHTADSGGSTDYDVRVTASSNAISVGGSVTATSLIKSGGSSVEFLKADGSTDSTSYLSLAGGTIDGSLIIDTDTGSQPFYVTRSGGLDQSLKIYISDENAVFESIQDETADNHGGFIFNMDAGTTHPFFDVRKNNSTIMRVDGSGNVGIGITGPNTKLHVEGNTPVIQIRETSGTAEAGISMNHSVSGNHYNWFLGTLDGSPRKLTIGATVTDGHSTNTAQAAASLMLLDQSTGNVGIGTTSPTEKLEVRGGVVRISASIGNDSGTLAFGNYLNGAGYYDNGIFRSALNNISSTGNTLHMGSYQALAFTTSPNPLGSQSIRMYISGTGSTAGNVGIGTTSFVDTRAAGGLHLANAKGIAFQATSSNTNSRAWRIRNDDLADWGSLNFAVGTTNSDFADAATDVVMTMLRSGNVGIGTTTPSAKLEVNGHFAATTKSFIIDNPETGGKLQYGVVESDQHSVLVRGKNDTETIELPEEWEWLVDGDSVTVDLTSIGQIQQLFVVSQDNKTIKIGGLATNGKYNYTVYGERKDVEKLEVNI